ncbi:MAG: hypothetical protein FXF47_00670 [Candidatus Mcinerneyibacterium aminivorans]|uniref:Metalloenzyme domain-containing protein n=1 Tax=Candidatus Mcinerneyibacterium aminivorans TaxID=2703815 RepID=A0A5D0MNF7_9BACT|nr:MAG: hypothetical protein FXF47_00670 [Candidatus Mcinerneyibacterium aminivorans]
MVLFIFVDGLGINYRKENNPLFDEKLKFLNKVIFEDSVPLNAKMGVEGIPQSATGQASIFTGKNCAKILGYHKEGFPNERLKKILKKESIFQFLKGKNLKSTFANGFIVDDKEFLDNSRFVSATTYMTLSSLGIVRGLSKLNENKAVYQDITNETLITRDKMEKRYEKLFPRIKDYLDFNQLNSLKKISPQKAARNLLNIADEYDFTLFEYFLTDKAGHLGDYSRANKVLLKFQELFYTLLEEMDFNSDSLIMISDHGNIEDLSISKHTFNRVPFYIKGKNQKMFSKAEYIYDIIKIFKANIHKFYNLQL